MLEINNKNNYNNQWYYKQKTQVRCLKWLYV